MRRSKLVLGIILISVIVLLCYFHFTKCKMKHSYKVFEGYVEEEIDPLQQRNDYTFINVKFNKKLKTKYYNNYLYKNYFSERSVKKTVYFVSTGKDTLILPENKSLKNNKSDSIGLENDGSKTQELVVKGKFGCFPSFIANENGDILYSESTSDYVIILLPMARHEEEKTSSVIELLEYYPFKISISGYNYLNNYFKNTNPYIDGGVDCAWFWDCDRKRLKVYDGSVPIHSEIEYESN